ncbi:hypothetical protein QTP70_012070 [Hemibagrus guttatus]|uniref:Uncharacterized protein n=1 Tax=Hemibagrus guttatus TaxID=175788 RepID=A0AAE0V0G5_9TELE|nr:hypothetical protein QTP70_012070 [Hemibagrus guttatus]
MEKHNGNMWCQMITSKSEAMVLDRKKVACTLQVGGEVLPQVEEFKYLGVLFTSEGRMDREIDRRIGAAAAVMRSMYQSVVVKKELSRKAKLSIYQSIYVPTLTYGHELWVMTERVRSWIQSAKMSFLRRVAGRSLRDRVRSSVTREELGVEPLLLHIERGQLRWLEHLFRMPPGRLPGEVFRACPTGKRPWGRPRTRWRDYVFRLAWECLGVPPEELEEVTGEREGSDNKHPERAAKGTQSQSGATQTSRGQATPHAAPKLTSRTIKPSTTATKHHNRATKTPDRTTKIPDRTTKTPERTTKTPDRTTKIPDRTTKTPERTTKTPDRTTKTPERTPKPQREPPKPRENHQNPRQSHQNPRQNHQDPKQSHQNPRENHQDPRQSHQNPRENHQNPRQSHIILLGKQILSSAKVNWAKSEAILVGEWGGGQPSLPGGLVWKRGGFKYLGVYLGTNEFLNKNWEGSVEHVRGRLSRWKRLVPKMSYGGRTLVINNLAVSSLWHKLACVDLPPNLLANIQAQLMDFFWDGLQWIPQSVLHLPKEEGGQGLVQLSSRAAAFRLQFIQRLLTGPRDLVWRAAASGLLRTVKGLGLDRALFLMDTKMLDISGLPMFYRGLFKIWNVFKKQNKGCRTVHWLLEEPLVYGGRLDISGVTVPALSRTLVSSGIVMLRELVNVAGSDLSMAEDLAARMGRSLRVVNQLLHHWRSALTSEERVQLMDYQHTETGPAEDEPFPWLNIAPDQDGCAGPLLECRSEGEMEGKLLYRACVKVLNKKKLSGRVDTPWRSVLGFNDDVKPEWRALRLREAM